jgi:hypothetical protein
VSAIFIVSLESMSRILIMRDRIKGLASRFLIRQKTG